MLQNIILMLEQHIDRLFYFSPEREEIIAWKPER